MASFIAGQAASGAYRLFAKDRNVLIPLDDIKKTSLITDEQLKKQFCDDDKSSKELEGILRQLKKASKKPPKRIISNLERVVDRLAK
jgi:hypothetical protein